MLSINMDDVINVINSIKGYLIGFGIVAVLLIVAMIACRKMKKSKKYLIRFNAVLGIVLALGVTVNLILVGPMYSMVTLATGGGTTVALTVVTLSALTCRATVLTAVRLTLLGYGETHLVALVTLLMIELRQRIGK